MPILPTAPSYDPLIAVSFKPQAICANNSHVALNIDLESGSFGLQWSTGTRLSKVSSEVQTTNEGSWSTTKCSRHLVSKRDIQPVNDALGRGIKLTVHHLAAGLPEIRQEFWLYDRKPEAIVRVSVVGARRLSSNSLLPVVAGKTLRMKHSTPLQSLFVPYDNDSYHRYKSDGWGSQVGKGSHEVTAIYEEATRRGLIVGAIDHDTWKTEVGTEQTGDGELSILKVCSGQAGESTHDQLAHGSVSGLIVRSPRVSIGFYADWRQGLERYADLNSKVCPPLPWQGTVPFGWSSWSGHKDKINATEAAAATDFLADDLPWFRSGNTAYINLDSYWDNLSEAQRADFVKHAHAQGLKAGIYYTPFVAWGKLQDKVAFTHYTYGDIVLKDDRGVPLKRLDGGYPIDPTHPGSIRRVDDEMAYFMKLGFDFIKLDFLSHAALEGHHFDPKVQTGTQAYIAGMKRIVEDVSEKKVGRPVFLALSIAPLFPSGFGHSRRISCDVFANIGATEYLLNSTTYGWWAGGRLYRFNDGDSSCVYQPLGEEPVSEAESRSRITASVISGGIVLEGDDLTKPKAEARVLKIYSNRELLDLARLAVSFRPLSGDTGSKACDSFELTSPDHKTIYFASFNYDSSNAAARSIPLQRLGITNPAEWRVHNIWTGTTQPLSAEANFILPPKDCVLLKLTCARGGALRAGDRS